MFTKFFKENRYFSVLLLFARLYLGYEWLMAGYEKVTKGFDASGFLKFASTLSKGAHPAVQSWWSDFLTGFAIPNAGFFTHVIPYAELAVGLGLLLGCFTTLAGFFALVMNFAFMFSGSTSTNVQMALLTIFVVVAGTNAGRIGVDRFVLPYTKNLFKKLKK